VTIQLTEHREQHLARVAKALRMTPEELATRLLATLLQSCDWSATDRERESATYQITDWREAMLEALEEEP
jgi:hypothetical protein